MFGNQLEHKIHNTTILIPFLIDTMKELTMDLKTSGFGMAATGAGPDKYYGLAECHGDLSLKDCQLCFAEGRTILPLCLKVNGGMIFLDGCLRVLLSFESILGQMTRLYVVKQSKRILHFRYLPGKLLNK